MKVEISHDGVPFRDERPDFRGPLYREEWEFETTTGGTERVVSWVADVSSLERALDRCPGDEVVVARADHRHHPEADYVVQLPDGDGR